MFLIAAVLLSAAPQNVVLVTWDGVRWQDVFRRGPEAALPRFWARHAAHATVFGDPASSVRFEVANVQLVSLPGYQELMTGSPVDCPGNGCGRVKRETIIDALDAHGLGDRCAVLGSWWQIADAASMYERTFVDAGRKPGEPAAPWGAARRDRETWAKAMSALQGQPRFLWVALNDSDEWAHLGRRDELESTLRQYDIWLDELLETLRAMPGYGENTTVIVSTDHGRGDGAAWVDHGRESPEARRIFAFAIGPGTGEKLEIDETFTHRDVRPTIEALLGLGPRARVLPGVTLPLGPAVTAQVDSALARGAVEALSPAPRQPPQELGVP
ncbi:MAG: alkaline phosphatase family protein [Myxococcaceae bacterium]|nr:alkaline phosphatase family protein [Myxococcaceae bacterium]